MLFEHQLPLIGWQLGQVNPLQLRSSCPCHTTRPAWRISRSRGLIARIRSCVPRRFWPDQDRNVSCPSCGHHAQCMPECDSISNQRWSVSTRITAIPRPMGGQFARMIRHDPQGQNTIDHGQIAYNQPEHGGAPPYGEHIEGQ